MDGFDVVKCVETHWAKIFIAGDINTINQVCREYCFEVGFCVSVEPTKYIYTGGEEDGATIGLINYPRFPDCKDDINEHAKSLGFRIASRCCQNSYTIMTPENTTFYSRRAE